MLIHLPPQTCVLASPNAADGCAVHIDSLPPMGVLINSLASMPRVHCRPFGLMPRVHCHFQLASMPWVHCPFQLASMPQVHCRFNWLQCHGFIAVQLASLPRAHCLSFGLMPRVHCHIQLALLPYLGYIAFPIGIPHCSYAFLVPHMPLWHPICLLVPHLPFGAHICLFGSPLIVAFCRRGR